MVADARAGRGPVGELLTRTNALQWVQDNQDSIRQFGTGLGAPALNVVRGAGTRSSPPSPCSCCPIWACWKDPSWWTTRLRCSNRPAPSGSAGRTGLCGHRHGYLSGTADGLIFGVLTRSTEDLRRAVRGLTLLVRWPT